jgi:hypothetical protein
MNEPIPVVEAEEPDAGDVRLLGLLDQLEAQQIGFLDEAGKRVIELSSVMLGLLFAVLALGDPFPPAWLASAPRNQWLALGALGLYLLALGAGVAAVQPRQYVRPRADLTRMRAEVDRIVAYKRNWFRLGTWLLGGASLCLAALVAALILQM